MSTGTSTIWTGELWDSRESIVEWDDERATMRLTVATGDPRAAKLMGPAMYSTVDGMTVVNKRAARLNLDSCVLECELRKNVRAHYGGDEPPRDVGDSIIEFDTAAQSEHVNVARSQVIYGDELLDYDSYIGVDAEGNIEGCDIYVPSFTYVETHFKAAAAVTSAYLNTLYRLTGRVNNDTWRFFDEGEALFLGARGRKETTEKYSIAYTFLGSPNTIFYKVIGDDTEATAIEKPGHAYVWYQFQKSVAAKKLKVRIATVNVATVYAESNFAELAIGS